MIVNTNVEINHLYFNKIKIIFNKVKNKDKKNASQS